MKIIVVEPEGRDWPELFRQEAKRLRAVFGEELLAIHHIGSTSVLGLAAKPIIDILPVARNIALVDKRNSELEALGYAPRGELGIPGRRFFSKGGDERTHHLHFFDPSSRQEIERHLAFRDYLRKNPEAAREYARLKKRLAQAYPDDIDAYCFGKDAFVKEMEKTALFWKERGGREGEIT